MRDRSAFVPCIPVHSIVRQLTKTVHTIGTKALRSLVRDEFYWVASGAASATLRVLPRYLPWLRHDALHPSAPDTTRVARLNQCFPSCATSAKPPSPRHPTLVPRTATAGIIRAVPPPSRTPAYRPDCARRSARRARGARLRTARWTAAAGRDRTASPRCLGTPWAPTRAPAPTCS